MNALPADDPPRPGLRERKKAKTRMLIQEHALRLFREQGYDETSVEEIADAAEVSPSTFFRYFPTKEDVVLYDPFDPILIEAFRSQPPDLNPVGALRAAMRTVLGSSPGQWTDSMRERGELILQVPELRRGMMDSMISSMEPFIAAMAERVGKPPDDFAVRNLVGAVMGVSILAYFNATGLNDDYVAEMDRALAHLEAGLPL